MWVLIAEAANPPKDGFSLHRDEPYSHRPCRDRNCGQCNHALSDSLGTGG